MKMKTTTMLLILVFPLAGGCNTIRKMVPGYQQDRPAEQVSLPDDYTVTGTTTENFQFVAPVRVIDSTITVRVKRTGEDWYQCDKFEIALSTRGTGGGGVRFQWRNLIVGGMRAPVAPAGTQYEIRSIVKATEHSLY